MKRMRFLLGAVLTLVLVIVLIQTGTVDSSAATATHSHPLCGNSCSCADNSHGTNTWYAWDGTTSLSGRYCYYLTQDVVLDSTMILNYGYTTNICLNGHSITCEDTVFDIYSYRTISITDCVGTGKIESTGATCTIGNNNSLTIWGGTIINSNQDGGIVSAINAYSNTNTYVYGGRIEAYGMGINAYENCKIKVQGGTIHGAGNYGSAIYGSANLMVSGGRITTQKYATAIDIQPGNFTMTDGYIGAGVLMFGEESSATVSGGRIDGELNVNDGKATVTGGEMAINLDCTGTVSAGTFHGTCYFWGTDITVSGGDFSDCGYLPVMGKTWICGGSYGQLDVQNGPLYISGVPNIDQLQLWRPSTVSAQSVDGTGSFGGDSIQVRLIDSVHTWEDGDVVIQNVKSDAVASRFTLVGADTEWMYLERSGNDLVLRILPHGSCGSSATWSFVDGVLTVSGTGTLDYAYSGTRYPWGAYCNEIKTIVVEPGITGIPSYAFEYCENVTSICLPETLSSLALNAFNDCGSLNNLLLPASLTTLSGSSNTGYPAFIRCESLTDLYYLGTEEQWKAVTNASRVTSSDSQMTIHYLQLCGNDATCTGSGVQPYYQFDETSIYSGMYDMNKQQITQLEVIPALGHDFVNHGAQAPTCTQIGWNAYVTCSRCDHTTYEEIPAGEHSYSKNIQQPTCTEQGAVTHVCDSCGYTYTEALSATGHSCKSIVTLPTCTQGGYTTYTCSNADCTYSYKTDETEALGHSGDVWVELVAPDCTQYGLTGRICEVCGETETLMVEPLGHSFGSVVTAPTCTQQGYTTNTCSVCGEVTITDYVNAKGHSWSAWIQVKAPSCAEEGSQIRFCNCGTKESEVVAKTAHTCENGVCTVCGEMESYYWVLSAHSCVDLTLSQDLYVDLNGYYLSGTIITNGYQVYGMDSTTNEYSCDAMGYFNCVDENGEVIVPASHFKTDAEMTGDVRRYMTIETESGYSFHRFYLGITSASLKPDTVGVGYKAVFYGDDMVKTQLDAEEAFGYCLRLDGYNAISRYKGAGDFVSGNVVTLRVNNYDVQNYGQTQLYASVCMQLADGTVIESADHSITLKEMVESVNANYTDYSADQLAAVQDMIVNHPTMQAWTVENLYTKEF